MGRSIPPIPLPTHPSLAIFLLLAWVAAAMAVVLSLCATCNPKPSADSSASSSSDESVAKPAADEDEAATAVQEEGNLPVPAASEKEDGEEATPVIVIDNAVTHGALPPTVLPKSASKLKMSMSISRGLHGKLRASRREWRSDGGEESLWKKTIILGGRCRVGGNDGGEEKGNGQQGDDPWSATSREASRNNSFANPNDVNEGRVGAEE